jgi:hypothetical protein
MPFHIYGFGGYRGEFLGHVRDDGQLDACPRHPWIEFNEQPPSGDLIAFGGTWNAQPRRVWEIIVSETYISVVDEYLESVGLPTTPVEIENIYRFDSEGDGFEEVLIAASYYEDDPNTPGVAAGDYSILILRALVDGEVVSIPLFDESYPSAESSTNPTRTHIGGILDLNGDGTFDLIAIGKDAFSTYYWTFDLTQPEGEPVLETWCRP